MTPGGFLGAEPGCEGEIDEPGEVWERVGCEADSGSLVGGRRAFPEATAEEHLSARPDEAVKYVKRLDLAAVYVVGTDTDGDVDRVMAGWRAAFDKGDPVGEAARGGVGAAARDRVRVGVDTPPARVRHRCEGAQQ